MRNFEDVVKEIKHSLDNLVIFDTFMNSAIIFLACYLALSITGMQPLYALAPATGFLLASLFFKLRENKILAVESAYPELREKLRTAADNLDMHNLVVDELHTELIKEVRHVEASRFFDEKKTYVKVMAVIILSFSMLFLTPIHFDAAGIAAKVGNITERIPINFAGIGNERFSESNLAQGMEAGAAVAGNLYGQRSVAVLGSEELLLQLKSASQDLTIRKESDVSQKDFTENYPNEIYVSSAASFEENIPKERQELVKNYFKNLAES